MSISTEHLILLEVDGGITPQQHNELQRRMASDPSIQESYDQILAVQEAFMTFEEKMPPKNLRSRILNSLPPADLESSNASKPGWVGRLWTLIMAPRPVSLAYAFTVGVLLTAGLFTVTDISSTASNTSTIAGTIRDASGEIEIPVAEAPETTRLQFVSSRISGVVVTTRGTDYVDVQLSFDAESSADIRIDYDDDALEPASIENRTPNTDVLMSSVERRLMLAGTGSVNHIFRFRMIQTDAPSPVVTILSDGEKIFEQ